ncbi:MAG: hypothetical protein HY961_05030 [Ignavibacteriae bacterium]|nr:hypothetical protein [Ignavibacteriota bacterium]
MEIPQHSPARRHVLMVAALQVLWILVFALSIVLAAAGAPTGDGFTRGLNRLSTFLAWQVAAIVVAVGLLIVARRFKTELSPTMRLLAKAPLAAHGLMLLVVVGAVLYALFVQ